MDGGIHAREWISPAALTYMANDLVKNWDKQPEHIQNLNWYILAVHNPDGYEFSHKRGNRFWRKNCNTRRSSRHVGVDLNRNYGYRWGEGEGGGDCAHSTNSEYYCGPHAFSETETEAVRQFFDQTKEHFCGFLTFHSYGQYILLPHGTTMSQSDSEDLSRVAEEGVKVKNFMFFSNISNKIRSFYDKKYFRK